MPRKPRNEKSDGHNNRVDRKSEKPKEKKKSGMRAFWSGMISFGLINIPVQLYSATEEHDLDLHMLRKDDLCPIRFARVCRSTGEEVPYDDIVKGYEYQKGDYVVLDDQDFKRADVKKTQTINVKSFTDEDEIGIMYFQKPYYLEPDKGAARSYALLREALRQSGKVAVCTFVLRTREYLAVLKAKDDVLVLDALRYHDEIRDPSELGLPAREDIPDKELDIALKLIDALTETFEPEQYHDTYREELEEIIEEKVRGKEPLAKGQTPQPTPIPDLMAALRASLEREEKRSHKGDYLHA